MKNLCRRLGTVAAFTLGALGAISGVQADVLFNPQVSHAVGDGPGSVAVGDLDGNGKLDLAVANEISDDVTILLGTGGGGFVPSGTYPTGLGTEPCSVTLGLFNGDGALDLVVANRNSGNVSVFLGVGDGTLGAGAVYAAGASPNSVVVGDVNEDDALDLAVCNSNGDDISILIGNGDGTFEAPVDYEVGDTPSQVAMGHLNGDSHLDLVAANQFSSSASVLLGNGDGTFQAAVHYGLGPYQYPSAVAIGTLNQDGSADLVVAREAGDDVAVLLGNGDGTFQTPVYYAAGSSPSSVAILDLDLDGYEDLAVADFANTGLVWILLGNGDGTFQDAVSYAAQSKASCVAIGDLDQAGTPDLAVTNYASDTVSVFLNAKETCNDTDHDGFGSPGNPTCSHPEEDCDDNNADINPEAPELCNGVDDDCDGGTADGADEAWMGSACDGPDTDFCEEGTYSCEGGAQACSDQTGNDVEICDGLDNNCDGSIPGRETDDDGDHYVECTPWVGSDPEIYGGGDCNDQDPERSPGLQEDPETGNCEDGKDNDCDGLTDTDDESCPVPGPCSDLPAG